VFLTIKFRSGAERRIWFETGKAGVYGAWSEKGGWFPAADFGHMLDLARRDMAQPDVIVDDTGSATDDEQGGRAQTESLLSLRFRLLPA
jgi:hypothetical protein